MITKGRQKFRVVSVRKQECEHAEVLIAKLGRTGFAQKEKF